MENKKKVLSLLSIPLILFICLFIPFKVNASKIDTSKIDAEVSGIYKNWNIEFNKEVHFDDETKNAVKVVDEDGNSIDVGVSQKDGKNITVLAPKEGYKKDKKYVISVETKVHTKNLKYLKNPYTFVFRITDNPTIYKYNDIVEKNIDAGADKILKKGIETDWEAIAICKSGKKIPDTYIDILEKQIKKNKGVLESPTDYERLALTISLAGENALNFGGYNLVDKIYNHPDIEGQGINAYVFALIALDSNNYEVPNSALWTRDKLIDKILECRTDDKGWDFAEINADPDMTGMVLTALSPYKERADVKKAIDEAVDKLSQMQNNDGTFSSYGHRNCESTSQVIIGLCSNGIDPTSKKFTKDKSNLLDALLSFKTGEGQFSHTQKDRYDPLATEQSILALEAYKDLKTGGTGIYKVGLD